MTKSIDRIRAVTRRDETICRLGGDGYMAAVTWAADGRQFVAVNDGSGWPEVSKNVYLNTRLFAISGSPQQAAIDDVPGYSNVKIWDYVFQGAAPYYGLNALAVDGHIYQYMSTRNHRFDIADIGDKSKWSGVNFTNAKLIYSPDGGRTWCNQDGSTPLTFESRQAQSRRNMVFFSEPQQAFTQLSFLQMGQDYRDNQDGYVYVYSGNGTTDGTMNELIMFRVPKQKILERGAYEYFAGLRADGNASWEKDINARQVVHTFPRGLLPTVWPFGSWLPSVVYNAPLGQYIMACSNGVGGDCIATKPGYLGFWVAPKPWGPWTQIHEETSWTPGGDLAARAGGPQIAPKWIAKDGKSLWLVWTDVQQTTDEDVTTPQYHVKSESQSDEVRLRWRQVHPYFSFNTQRIDLIT